MGHNLPIVDYAHYYLLKVSFHIVGSLVREHSVWVLADTEQLAGKAHAMPHPLCPLGGC
jgi:hypothetical protein